jgi:hypothetical protein
MAERREDVEELLRLKTNPFPDGTLEAPEFPRRVYASNVVQPVNAQLVAQSKTGPKLLQADDTGVMQVTIPPSVRPQKLVGIDKWLITSDINAGTYINHTVQVPYGFILRIVSLNLSMPIASGATTNNIVFDMYHGDTNSPDIWVQWPYNVPPQITASDPVGASSIFVPSTREAFMVQLHNLKFDYNYPPIYGVYNNTNGIISHTTFLVYTTYYLEEI